MRVAVYPYRRARSEYPQPAYTLFRMISREIVRDQGVMLLLGNMRAEERIAAFLLNLSQRLYSRGFAANDFILRMSREEIGSYLGLKLETVSRTLSKFHQEGLISVEHKHIKILNLQVLKNGIRLFARHLINLYEHFRRHSQ